MDMEVVVAGAGSIGQERTVLRAMGAQPAGVVALKSFSRARMCWFGESKVWSAISSAGRCSTMSPRPRAPQARGPRTHRGFGLSSPGHRGASKSMRDMTGSTRDRGGGGALGGVCVGQRRPRRRQRHRRADRHPAPSGPAPAVALAAVFHVVGALVVGTAVAATVAGIVLVPARSDVRGAGAAVLGALVWNLVTLWWGLPCSSGHCLVGALAGAALAEGGLSAVHWGGLEGLRPVGVFGSLLWLFFSTAIALPLAVAGHPRGPPIAPTGHARAVERPVRGGELVASAGLAFAHGSNDAQKTMGLMTAALVADGDLTHFVVPFWVMLASALLLTLGTLLGGWRVVRTLGRRIYRAPLAGRSGQPGFVRHHRPGRLAGRGARQHVRRRGPCRGRVWAPGSGGATYAGPWWVRSGWHGW